MKKALVVGVNYYQNIGALSGCISDAMRLKEVLSSNYNGSINFSVKSIVAETEATAIRRENLKKEIKELFRDRAEIALFYFAGHAYKEETGGYLLTSESTSDDGLSMEELITLANRSPAQNRVIILDCCHSGEAGNIATFENSSILTEGVTIMAAAKANQAAIEKNGNGLFTLLLLDALTGRAANFFGQISLSAIYAHIDQSLGAWQQRPVFKSNTTGFCYLREVNARLPLEIFKLISEYFPDPNSDYPLDPSYEFTNQPEMVPQLQMPYAKKENVEVFRNLQTLSNAGLVKPSKEAHMYFAALNSDSCKLTELGRHYWSLIHDGLI